MLKTKFCCQHMLRLLWKFHHMWRVNKACFVRGIAESVKLKEVNYLSSLVNSVCAEVDIEGWYSNDKQSHSCSWKNIWVQGGELLIFNMFLGFRNVQFLNTNVFSIMVDILRVSVSQSFPDWSSKLVSKKRGGPEFGPECTSWRSPVHRRNHAPPHFFPFHWLRAHQNASCRLKLCASLSSIVSSNPPCRWLVSPSQEHTPTCFSRWNAETLKVAIENVFLKYSSYLV